MSEFAARLAALDQQYEATEALGGSVPDGKYTAVIKKAFIEEDGRAAHDTLYLNVHYMTDKGMAFQNITLTNHPSERSMGFAKGQLTNLGYSGPISGVENILPGLIGQSADISVTTSTNDGKDYTNVTVRKLVTPVGGVAAAQSPFGQFNAAPAQTQQFDPATEAAFSQAGFPAPTQQQAAPVQQQFAAQPAQQAAPQQTQQFASQPVAQSAPVDFMQQPQSPSQAIQQAEAQQAQPAAQLPFLG